MKYILALVALVLSAAIPASAQNNLLVLDSASPGCGGPQQINNPYAGYFSATSFNIGGTDATTSTGGSVAPTFSALSLVKALDSCSAPLVTQFLLGATIPTITLVELVPAGTIGATAPLLTITLENARISSYSISDTAGGGKSMEQISFIYQKAIITSAAGPKPVTIIYNPATNTVSTVQ